MHRGLTLGKAAPNSLIGLVVCTNEILYKKNCADAKWGGVGEKRFAILGADVAVDFAMEGFLAEGLGGFLRSQTLREPHRHKLHKPQLKAYQHADSNFNDRLK